MLPYLIVSHDYTRISAGVRALHLLCHHLNERGYPAFVTSPVTCPDLNTPAASPAAIGSLSKQGIVVYPEVEEGNPLGALRVVRYILNIPGRIRGSGQFADNELLYCYCGLLRRFVPHRDRVLTIPVVETDVFNNTDPIPHREGTVYWVGKGKDTPRVPEVEDSVEITFDWPETRRGLAYLFKTSKWFYTYQTYTALTIEARLCGCPTVVIPNGRFDRQDFRWPPGMDGLAWGTDLEELQRAYLTVDRFPLAYQQQVVERFPHQLDMFIWVTQGWSSFRN
jgi:hypothetical protein